MMRLILVHIKLSESKKKVSSKGDFRLHGGNVRFPPWRIRIVEMMRLSEGIEVSVDG